MTGLRLVPWAARSGLAFAAGGLLAGVCGSVAAQPAPAATAGIYTCIDANGRRLTADRPIPELGLAGAGAGQSVLVGAGGDFSHVAVAGAVGVVGGAPA